ncbi:germin-like protein 3-1 [Elaeis guineensis]|uniref:Germin-like protein n=1 Tax=Elaeis guineensis var. tenera TaxID=51953 RepID=A0A8N4FAU8_ELAGV|nr:LOW QUALITY PROTEIN: germin-like protein 3-1 [Elaeis guineensis]
MRKYSSFPTLFPFLLLSLLFSPSNPDPDLLVDYCVADTSPAGQSLHLNGLPCLDPALARPSHFATSILSMPGNTAANPLGFNVTLTTAAALPGANAQGLSLARVDLAGGGLVPPHAHPRASEVALLLHGDLLVGFVDTSYRFFTQRLRPGDAFVFPRGLVHFLYNLNPVAPAVAVSGLNSQNPGVQMMPLAAFRSDPRIPEVLKKTFKISAQDMHRIQKNLGGLDTGLV